MSTLVQESPGTALGGPVLVPGIVMVDGPALCATRVRDAYCRRCGVAPAWRTPARLVTLFIACSPRRSRDRQSWGRVQIDSLCADLMHSNYLISILFADLVHTLNREIFLDSNRK